MKFTILQIDPYGDGYVHLYYDGKLVTEGDDYHNKINDYIEGFIAGFNQALNFTTTEERVYFAKEDWEYEDYFAEPTLEATIAKLKRYGFKQQVFNE